MSRASSSDDVNSRRRDNEDDDDNASEHVSLAPRGGHSLPVSPCIFSLVILQCVRSVKFDDCWHVW